MPDNATNSKDTLVIPISGHISVDNANELNDTLNVPKVIEHNGDIVLDTDKLMFISSAGLRVILRFVKSRPDTKIINVRPEVYSVFEMTGFTEIVEITRAYREISIDGCEEIGHGANGAVYRIDAETIVKVYKDADALDDINRERELARIAFIAGIPTAISYDVVRVGDMYGAVYEHLDAQSIAQLITSGEMSLDEAEACCVKLLKRINDAKVDDPIVPDRRAIALKRARNLEGWISYEALARVIKLIEEIPCDENVIHGDFHAKNIMLQNGEVLLIDMDTLSHGNTIFELSGIYTSYIGYAEVDYGNADRFLSFPEGTSAKFCDGFFDKYFADYSQEEREATFEKIYLLSAIRVTEHYKRKKGIDPQIIKNCEVLNARIEKLAFQLDTLAI